MIVIIQIILLMVMTGVLFWMCIVFISGIISNLRGAPYVPMKRGLTRELLAFGGLAGDDIFYDLGSGDGRVLFMATRDFDVRQGVGYEAAPWPYYKCYWRIKWSRVKNISVHRQNFFDVYLGQATFIYAYLFPKTVDRLATKLEQEGRSGTKILLASFPIDIAKHPLFLLKKEAKIGNITAYLYEKI